VALLPRTFDFRSVFLEDPDYELVITAQGVMALAADLVTGTVAETQADQTSAASGQIGVQGTVAATQADQTSAASGIVWVIGTVAETQADDTSAASGAEGKQGTVAETQADDTSAAAGLHGGSTQLIATGDGTLADVVDELNNTTNIWQSIDDPPDTPVDTDWINNQVDEASAFFDFTDVPGAFVTALGLRIEFRFRGQNWGSGTRNLYARIYQSDESTALTDEMLVQAVTGDGSYANATVTFTGVVGSTKAIWNAARIRFRWSAS
jgi:hypothetical protein